MAAFDARIDGSSERSYLLSLSRLVKETDVDLKEVIHDRFGVDYHERSVSRLLHELGFSHMSARPRHPGQDPEMLETFKKTSPGRSPRR